MPGTLGSAPSDMYTALLKWRPGLRPREPEAAFQKKPSWWHFKPLMPPSVGFQSNVTIMLKANPVMVVQSEVEIKRQDFEIFRIGLLG